MFSAELLTETTPETKNVLLKWCVFEALAVEASVYTERRKGKDDWEGVVPWKGNLKPRKILPDRDQRLISSTIFVISINEYDCIEMTDVSLFSPSVSYHSI